MGRSVPPLTNQTSETRRGRRVRAGGPLRHRQERHRRPPRRAAATQPRPRIGNRLGERPAHQPSTLGRRGLNRPGARCLSPHRQLRPLPYAAFGKPLTRNPGHGRPPTGRRETFSADRELRPDAVPPTDPQKRAGPLPTPHQPSADRTDPFPTLDPPDQHPDQPHAQAKNARTTSASQPLMTTAFPCTARDSSGEQLTVHDGPHCTGPRHKARRIPRSDGLPMSVPRSR